MSRGGLVFHHAPLLWASSPPLCDTQVEPESPPGPLWLYGLWHYGCCEPCTQREAKSGQSLKQALSS